FRVILWGMAQLLKYAAWRYPVFRARLKERNLVAQLKARDEEIGRWYAIHGGKVRSGAGLRADADVTLAFKTAALGADLLMTPIDLEDADGASWTIRARGLEFTPPRKTTLAPHGQNAKSIIYSPDRLLYPMKRVDFDPDGERNPQNRGKSGYVRISWQEALDLVGSEIKRLKRQYGPGVMAVSHGSHHTWGNIGYYLSALFRFR